MDRNIIKALEALPQQTRARGVTNLREATELFAREVRESLGTQGSEDQHSRPGESPRRQSGALQRGITAVVDEAAMTGHVRSNVPYGKVLEEGTSRVAARPFIAPVRERLAPRIDEILRRR